MALRTPHINIHDSHGRMGVLSRAGQLTVPCRFAYIGDADCYPPYAFEASEEAVPESLGACDIIDHTGKRLNPSGVKALAGTLWFGLAVVVREDDPQGKQGFMASDGRLLGDIRWHALTRHNSRLALAQDPESKLWVAGSRLPVFGSTA